MTFPCPPTPVMMIFVGSLVKDIFISLSLIFYFSSLEGRKLKGGWKLLIKSPAL
ncbi:hypothetical protein ASZ90_007590 [hydrocarbon metagenome]|uniref:Uncharacterized protein n=1 Tax=hydrocarbon metagenome TaxID=938273 RepID=A0A0W8FNY5_9ZZZZ